MDPANPVRQPGLDDDVDASARRDRRRDGKVIACRSDGRNAFDRSFDGRWDPLNLAYFNGYAMWTYHAAPFVLAAPGYESSEIAAIEHEGETLRGVSVRFPESVHTHTREQRSTSVRMGCSGVTTMKWTYGQMQRQRISCRNTSLWED